MNSQRDTEEFVKKFDELSKEMPTNIFFSIYKSKVDRINQSTIFKKYNAFNKENDFGNQQQQNVMYKSYNNFVQTSKIYKLKHLYTYIFIYLYIYIFR
jgi:hypothetical protein